MRITILAAILLVLLLPGLRPGAAASSASPLAPTEAFPGVSGTVQSGRQDDRATLTINLHGLRTIPPSQSQVGGSVYVAWMVDEGHHLYNLGTLTSDAAGDAVSTFTPIVAPTGTVVLAISAEPRGGLPAPTAPRETVFLSGQLALAVAPTARRLDSDFGPDWFAPILPAAIGLALLRHAARTRRAELRARPLPPLQPQPGT